MWSIPNTYVTNVERTNSVQKTLEDMSNRFAKFCGCMYCLFAKRSIELGRQKGGWLVRFKLDVYCTEQLMPVKHGRLAMPQPTQNEE